MLKLVAWATTVGTKNMNVFCRRTNLHNFINRMFRTALNAEDQRLAVSE
jgi:hypothetical protein